MLRFLLLLVLLALPLTRAAASPLPQATYSVTLNGVEVSQVSGSFASGGALGSIASLPNPSAHAHVEGTAQSFEQMIYWFRIDGPSPGAHVPVVITGNVSISAGGAVFAQNLVWGTTAQLIAQSYDGQLLGGSPLNNIDSEVASVDCNPASEGPISTPPPIGSCSATVQSEPVILHLDAIVGADNRVVLNAATNNKENFVAHFDALVDPTISLGAGVDPSLFTILLSDGVGNTVPEPGTALLIGLGSASLVFLGRRKG
jgi:PEP-CTERM motif-containing protein